MRTIVRNSFARQSIQAERLVTTQTCAWCGGVRKARLSDNTWLYRFHVDDDSGSRHSGPIAGGKLFCSRGCAESYTDQPFDETKGRV